MATIFHNAAVFTAESSTAPLAEAFAVSDGNITAVGSLAQVRSATPGATEVDLGGRFVMPGVIDSHSHLAPFGDAQGKVQLRDCRSLKEIQDRLVAAYQANPQMQRLTGISWMFDAVGTDRPTAAMIDEVLPDIPVYLDANDLHSMWINTAAIREMGLTKDTPDPVGGEITRDADGNPNGMLIETACMELGWTFLAEIKTADESLADVQRAFSAYLETGVTGATLMSLNPTETATIRSLLARDGKLPFPLTAHWIIQPSGDAAKDLAEVQRVAQLQAELEASGEADWLRVVGIKLVMDGTIDACTATMQHDYANGTNGDPIWSGDSVLPIVAEADRLGLQIALHAIGDQASVIALDAVEYAIAQNGARERRHRIEHLESATLETAQRMARLNVTASMQPVHSDPAVLENWKAMLGDERAENGFKWQMFREQGVAMTLGTDAPTAPHEPLPNLYIALTGASVLQPELDPYHPERVFSPAEALIALTAGAAYAGLTEDSQGTLAAGKEANFIVLDVNPLEVDPLEVRDAKVHATFVRGVQMV